MKIPCYWRRNACGTVLACGMTLSWGLLSNAQFHDPVWTSGSTQITFPHGDVTQVQVQDLPTPTNANIPAQFRYSGAVANTCQYGQYDREGKLLFFIVDGNFYNADGYLIADAALSPNDLECSTCFYPGQEIHVFPVPGSCSRYFVFSLYSVFPDGSPIEPPGLLPQTTSRIRVGVLDLTLPSENPSYGPNTCIVNGRFMDEIEQIDANLYVLTDMDGATEPIDGDLAPGGDPRNYLIEGVFGGPNPDGLIRAATIQLDGEERGIAVVRLQNRLATLLIEANGIRTLTTPDGFPTYAFDWPLIVPPYYSNTVEDNDESFRGEMALSQVGNELRVAYSSYVLYPWQGEYEHEPRISYWRFTVFPTTEQDPGSLGFIPLPLSAPDPNPKTYAPDHYPLNTPTPPLDFANNAITRPAIGGLEFSPNGRYLYFTRSSQGTSTDPTSNFGCIDLNVPCIAGVPCPAFIYPNIGGPLEARKLADTQLCMNRSPGGAGDAMYMIGADALGDYWLASFTDPNDPTNGTWTQETAELPSVSLMTASDGTTQYRLLNHRVANSSHFLSINREVCCEDFVKIKDQSREVPAGTGSWSATDNPFCDRAIVHIATELRLLSGANIIASNITFKFAANAKLIIERGAKLTATNCTFTSACLERWDGIRVEGNTANTYQGDNPDLALDQEQGRLILTANSVVENAWIGVWCARETESHDPHPDYNGGWVKAYSTTFRNCVYGTRAQGYHRMDGGVIEQTNLTSFQNCSFLVDNDWTTWQPFWEIRLDDVRHVKITNCRFENVASDLFVPDEGGGGVQLNQASAYIDGNGDPNSSYFKNLQFGVMNSAGVFAPVRVSRMHFENNRIGIADLESTFVEYGGNTFHVTDQGTAPNARVGMLLYQTHGLTVEENVFTGDNREHSVGIFFAGVRVDDDGNPVGDWNYNEERIYNNTFNNLQAGTLIHGLHRGSSSGEVDAGLQVLCGDYTDNLFDIAVLERSIIRPNQGQVGSSPELNILAGNRFFNFADCASNYDWALDVNWNNVNNQTAAEINYRRHEFPVLEVGVTCDVWPRFDNDLITSFIDQEIPQSGLFIKETHCGAGEYPIQQEGMGGHVTGYTTAKTLLTDAINAYEGTVDLGETPDLKDAILRSTPWLSSTYLRDLLMAKHPLSDDILALVIKREVPMDAWHLTQVLLQNSKLNPGIWQLVEKESTLSPYFRAMIAQAQQGTGLSVKQALEHEIVHRRLQMAEHMNVLGHLYARDTIGTPSDSLEKLLLFDKDKENLMQKVNALIKLERYAEAQAMLNGELDQFIGKEVLEDLMAMQQSTQGNWKELSQVDKDQLWVHAESGKAGAGQAAGILFSIGVDAPLPEVRFPNFTKSNRGTGGRREHYASPEPNVACFPNPSDASSFLTYPAELDGTTLVVFDAKGSEVERQQLKGNGLVEIETKGLPAGVYQVALLGTPFTTKLSVQH